MVGSMAQPESACEECGKKLVPGLTRCGACGPPPTPGRLVLVALVALALGLPALGVGGVLTLAAAKNGAYVGIFTVALVLGLLATLGGAVDLVRALLALGRGDERCYSLGVLWVARAFGGGRG